MKEVSMNSLSIPLTTELSRYVEMQGNDNATQIGYVVELIRKDMREREVMSHVMQGLDDMKNGRFSTKTARDFMSDRRNRV